MSSSRFPRNFFRVPDSEFDRIRKEAKPHVMFGATDTDCESCHALRDEVHISHMRIVELERAVEVYRQLYEDQHIEYQKDREKLRAVRKVVW